MKVSQRAEQIRPSLTRKLFNMAQSYKDVVDLTLGDPDFDPPVVLKNAACRAIKEGKTHYSPNAGLKKAREAVAMHVERIWKVRRQTDEIIVTVGGMEALYLALLCLIDPGDEVIVFAPYYVNYIQMIQMCGGIPVILDSYTRENGLQIKAESLADRITEKTAAIIVNSPHNPTGDVLDRESLEIIAKAAKENNLVIISDEVYRTLLYDGIPHESILQYEDVRDRIVLVDSLSKEYSMTGYRIGYACGPVQLIENMTKLQENVAACASVPSQYALIEAYQTEQAYEVMRKEFQERRDFIYAQLSAIEGIRCRKPKGTFYLFANIRETGMQSEEFAEKLLEEQHVAVVPGCAYGALYDDYIRIAFTKEMNILRQAVKRIRLFILDKKGKEYKGDE